MDVKADFSDIDAFVNDIKNAVTAEETKVGQEAIDYAVKNGTYKDHTGTLRKSNKYEVDEQQLTLTLTNDALNPKGVGYASFVEAKGFDVLGNAALFAENELNKAFE
jgi:hypothetical protein